MTNTIYYLQPNEVCQLVERSSKHTVFSLHHRFYGARGEMYRGSVLWQTNADTTTMEVRGNSQPYIHSSVEWLANGYWTDGVAAMAWTKVAQLGEFELLQFVTAPPTFYLMPKDHTIDLGTALRDANREGWVDLRSALAKNVPDATIIGSYTITQFQNAQLLSVANFLHFITPGVGKIVIPKQLVGEVAFAIANKPRDAQTFRVATDNCKKQIQKFKLMTPNEMAQAIPIVTTLAFTLNLDLELAQLFNMQVVHGAAIDQHKEVVQITTRVWWASLFDRAWYKASTDPPKTAVYIIAAVAIIYIALKRINRPLSIFASLLRLWRWLREKIAAYRLIGTGFPAFFTRYPITFFKAAGSLIPIVSMWSQSGGPRQAVVEHAPIGRLDICMRERPLQPISYDSTVDEAADVVCKPNLGHIQYGPGVLERVPCNARSCSHNEIVAIRNRITKPVQAENPLGWFAVTLSNIISYCETENEDAFYDYFEKGSIRRVPFATWILQYPPQKRAKLIKARENLVTGYRKRYDQINMFVKKEHILKSFPEDDGEQPLYDPRAIQGRSDEYNVQIGTFIRPWSKFLCASWICGHYLVYGSGKTAEQVGLCFTYMRARECFQRLWFHMDAERLDCSLTKSALNGERMEYDWAGAAFNVSKAIKGQQSTTGATPLRTYYTTEHGRHSGDNNTSCGNAPRTAGPIALLRRIGWDIDDQVSGDDNYGCVYLTQREYNELAWSKTHSHSNPPGNKPKIGEKNCGSGFLDCLVADFQVFKTLGIKMEIHYVTDHRDVEFCSGLFYPTGDYDVYGPKIGRVIAKTFYAKEHLSPVNACRWLRGVAKGMEKETSFIPILRVLITTVLKLTKSFQDVDVGEFQDEHGYMARASEYHEVDDNTMDFVCYRYSITHTDVMEIETLIAGIKHLPCTIFHPALTKILDVDAPRDVVVYQSELDVPKIPIYSPLVALLDSYRFPANLPYEAPSEVHYRSIVHALRMQIARAPIPMEPPTHRGMFMRAGGDKKKIFQLLFAKPMSITDPVQLAKLCALLRQVFTFAAPAARFPKFPLSMWNAICGQTEATRVAFLTLRLLLAVAAVPALEEAFKRLHPFCANLLIWMEFLINFTTTGDIMACFVNVVLHYCLLAMPYKWAVLCHSLLNMSAVGGVLADTSGR
jgi:hypothetical protein